MAGLYFYDDTRSAFIGWARDFCQRHPRYQQKDGSPALGHLLNAANAEGYSEINAGNIAEVQAALEVRAKCKEKYP